MGHPEPLQHGCVAEYSNQDKVFSLKIVLSAEGHFQIKMNSLNLHFPDIVMLTKLLSVKLMMTGLLFPVENLLGLVNIESHIWQGGKYQPVDVVS